MDDINRAIFYVCGDLSKETISFMTNGLIKHIDVAPKLGDFAMRIEYVDNKLVVSKQESTVSPPKIQE